ncbi:PAS-domain containing protein [Planktotalea sp.]|uniref:hybrid sensor histidine kinase/response regulator n=1 Tax=Planktotalea sp. TaxID=2029877 RepID=UPI0025D5C048|nr:PAS-domain containing protein [Planktotalea sp.]
MNRTPSQRKMLEAGLNLIQQAMSIFDSNLRLVLINRQMQQMFSLPSELVQTGVSFDKVIRFLAERGEYGEIDDLDEFVANRAKLARTFEAHYMERKRANGRMISVEGAPLPEGGWVTVYTDITEIKQQEALLRTRSEALSEQVLVRSEELAKTNRALASSNAALEEAKHQLTQMEARTRLTTQMMPAHIAHIDLDQRYTFSNRRLQDVMPGSTDEIIGLTARDALGPATHAVIEPHIERAFDGVGSVFEFTHDPSSRRIRVALTPDSVNGDMQGIYVLSMDITEETQTRVALQQTRRREMAAQLTSGLAHDFSNLLTIILGMQGKLERMDSLPSEAKHLIAATLAAARRGGGLLHRIADMTGPREFRPAPIRLSAFLSELQTMASPTVGNDHRLQINQTTPDGTFNIDADMLQDSLLNLILNARDATPPGGQISLIARAVQDTWLELEVADTGTGFTEQALKKALHPFFTTKGGEGSGLGLAMVYDMTKLAGGDVRLFNDNGAHVVLRLPLRPTGATLAPGLVLLVEDSEDLRMSIRDMLMAQGHLVLEATSIHEAEALLASVPDIAYVLSDIHLSGARTGLDLVQITQLPLTLMTSLPVNDPLHQAAAQRGAFLHKPFSEDALRAALAKAEQTQDAAHE